jgi:hypothetical protein
MQKEIVKEVINKIIIFSAFLMSSFLLSILSYPFVSQYFKTLFPLLMFDNYLSTIYFFFIFSICYLIFELISYFLNDKKAMKISVLIVFFSMMIFLWSIDMTDEPEAFIIYLLIMTCLVLTPLLSFHKLIKSVKIKTSIIIVYLILFMFFSFLK